MRNTFFIACTLLVSLFTCLTSFGQERKIREADIFWKKRVVNRISLIEKINKPLVTHAPSYYGQDDQYAETDGIVVSLINGVRGGKYQAIHPDNWDHEMNYAELRERMEEFEKDLMGDSQWEEEEDDVFAPANDFLMEETDDLSSQEREDTQVEGEAMLEGEDWPFEELEAGTANEPVEYIDNTFDHTNFEKVLHIVEDWIFDKGSSEMVQRIAFFEIIWVDPSGSLPEQVLARFKWEDVKEQMEQTKWQNMHNDGESKSMKEIVALRRFNSLVIHLGNRPIRSLHEAIQAKRELVEFEHNLWSY
ncbi:MAG: hypothetical protein AAF694_01380 [Bacteroidota bacterium]